MKIAMEGDIQIDRHMHRQTVSEKVTYKGQAGRQMDITLGPLSKNHPFSLATIISSNCDSPATAHLICTRICNSAVVVG